MHIFRIEDDEGRGPYRSYAYDSHDIPSIENLSEQTRPSPYLDDIHFFTGLKFGFLTMKQFREWFPRDDTKKLLRRGFTIRKFKVGKKWVVVGRRQVAFHPLHATVIKEYSQCNSS